MQYSIILWWLLFIKQPILAEWNFWKLMNRKSFWEESYEAKEEGYYWNKVNGRLLISLFGYPSNCELKGVSHACTLSVACWWVGGTSQSGCGASSWLIACCIPKKKQNYVEKFAREEDKQEIVELKESVISHQSIQRRNNIISNDITSESDCGIANDRILSKRIVGGQQAGFGQFPWQAFIKISSYQCGGVLVSKKFIATAAHCILPAKLTELLVYLGELDTKDTGDVEELEPAELHRVKRRIIHPQFNYRATQPDRYDLALLELITEAGFNIHISPICLPESGLKLKGREAVVAGWGKTDALSKKTGTNILRSVSVPILDIKECVAWHKIKQITVELYPEMLCAGHELGKQDACMGDSGGPLILLENGKWTLVGITSAGFGCGEAQQPGIYHNVPTSVEWIKSVIYH